MLNTDTETRLLLARERAEDLRRQYGGEPGRTARKHRRRSGTQEWHRRRSTRVLDWLLGRTPGRTPAYRA
jgi:hypothetical protein